MTTKHTCGGPVFGRKTAGCPRCDELTRGAVPVRWDMSKRDGELRRGREIRTHNCVASHCGPVCTFGDW